MKKSVWIALLLMLVCIFSFSACDQGDTPPANDDVCQHTFGDWNTTKQATCKDEGELVRVCSKCSAEEKTTVAKTNVHTEVIDAAVSPTCEVTGLTEGKHCSYCNKVIVEQTIIGALGHKFVTYVPDGNATTAADGTKTAHCENSGCNKTDTITDVGSKLPIDHTHSYTNTVTAPTCTEKGYTTHSCTCGHSYIDTYTNATNHKFITYVSDGNATTEADGTKTAHCENSGCNKTDTITDVGSKLPNAHNHSYTSVETKPTCTQQGFTTHTCSCGDSYQDSIVAAKGHKFDSTVCSQCNTNVANHAIESYDVSVNLDGKITAYVVETDGTYSLYVLGTGEMKNYTSSNTPLYNDGYHSKITTVYIGDSIESIGDYFLYLCMKVTDIRVPSSLKSIGEFAIAACDALDDISLPNGLTNIANYAFYSSGNITTVTIPNTVTTIGQNAFKDCTKLENIVIGENSQLKVLGNAAFSNTAYYNDSSNWDGKVLYIDCCLIKAKTTISGEFTVGSNVKVVAENAFDSCASLTKVIVPDTVNSIGKSAFYKCDGLKFIQLPFSGATKDGSVDANFGYVFGAYSGYSNSSYVPTSLIEVVITGGEKIDSKAFYGLEYIQTLTLPYVGTSLNSGEFFGAVFGATNTSNYVVPDSLTTITILSGDITAHAFYGCDSLINVYIEDGVTSIGEGAFYNCSSIQNIKLPFVGQNSTVTSGYNAVFGYIFGYGVKTISYGTTGTGAGMYWSMSDYDVSINQYSYTQSGKQYLYYYKVPNTLKTVTIIGTDHIPQEAFYKCSMIDCITVPKDAEIGRYAFDSCSAKIVYSCKENEHNIVSIERVEPTCQSVGNTEGTKCSICGIVFSGNVEIKTIPHEFVNGACSGCGEKEFSKGLLFTLDESSDTYIVSGIGTCTDVDIVIPSKYNGKDVTIIGEEAFYNCATIQSITIPSTITKSRSLAFYGCSSLKAVYIDDIAAWCSISFVNMRYSNPLEQAGNLYLNGALVEDLVIPSGVTKIGTLAFINCQSLTSIEIPNSVICISQGAFNDCVNLKTVKLGTGITELWDSFTGCTSLENLYIYDLEKYCNIEFVNGSSGKSLQYATKLYLNNVLLKTITVPSGITNFSNAFTGYKSLQKITLPSTITAITSNAFSGCSELTEVLINEGPTKIEGNAFYNCSKLKNIVIPDSVLSIADSAFKNCTALETIEIGDGVSAIPSNCFTNLDNLVSVVIGNGVTQIGTGAFSYCDNLQIVTFGENVKTIDTFAFGQCYALKSVVLPKALETIGFQAFYYCKGLEKIEFSSSLKKIGAEAFYCCDSVVSMIFNGTQAQWNSVSKGSNWNRNIPVGITIKS